MNGRWRLVIAAVDSLSRRDRLVMAGGLLALVIGLDAALVLPLRAKRERIEQAVGFDVDAQAAQQQQVLDEQAARRTDLQARQAALARRLAAIGLQAHGGSLPAFLARTLRGHAIAPVAVRVLPVEALNLAPAGDAPAQPATTPAALLNAAMAGAAGAASAVASAVLPSEPAANQLYRHRAELTFEGPLPELLQAIALTEHQLAPLRVERLRLQRPAGAIDGRVQAVLVLTAISQESTWFAL